MSIQISETVRLVGSMAATIEFNWDSYGWIVGLLLIALFSAKEMVRAYGGPATAGRMRAFTLASIPLLALFAVAIVDRLLPLVLSAR